MAAVEVARRRTDCLEVLLVDGNERFGGLLAELLDDEPGFRVIGRCDRATDALRLVRRRSVDVVLTADRLSEGTGEELLAAVRDVAPHAVGLLWTADAQNATGSGAADALLERGMSFRSLVRVLQASRRRSDALVAAVEREAKASRPERRQEAATAFAGRALGLGSRAQLTLAVCCDDCATQELLPQHDHDLAFRLARAFLEGHERCRTRIDLTAVNHRQRSMG